MGRKIALVERAQGLQGVHSRQLVHHELVHLHLGQALLQGRGRFGLFVAYLYELGLVVDELALFAIAALVGSVFVPVLAHLSLVVLVQGRRFLLELIIAVSVSALGAELAGLGVLPVAAEFGLVVDAEVLNVPDHLLLRAENNLLLLLGALDVFLAVELVQLLLKSCHGGIHQRGVKDIWTSQVFNCFRLQHRLGLLRLQVQLLERVEVRLPGLVVGVGVAVEVVRVRDHSLDLYHLLSVHTGR
mmetsp:Transcript_38816/g.59015  ORF Transcript_38816/g.59015 Transcript_38816/m.59015 type:complete len:244 (-) Transcript_38816:261-992(-)